jgi:predicted amidohydrolase YtcJ
VTRLTGNPGVPRLADLIVKAGRVYSMNAGRDVHTALAIRDGWIVAVSDVRDGLDALASEGTQIIDDPGLTLLPAFFDIHEHLLDSARNLARVRLEDAHSIDDLIALIRGRAEQSPEGEWIQTSNGWNESNLTEGRLPTAAELDRASTEHPILAPRGGATYAALGVGSVREALILLEGWEVYQSAWEQGRLPIRCLPLLLVDPFRPQPDRLRSSRDWALVAASATTGFVSGGLSSCSTAESPGRRWSSRSRTTPPTPATSTGTRTR